MLNFIYNLKMMLIGYWIDAIERNKRFLLSYFHIKSISIFTRIEGLGKCSMKFCVLRTNDLFTSLKNIYIRIDIYPEFCRTKLYKFLLNI